MRRSLKPDKEKCTECYVDADFASGWAQAYANNAENLISLTGYVVMYAGFTVLWCSKLRTGITLSTTEAEYTALIQAMRNIRTLWH